MMNTSFPLYPENISNLEQAVEHGIWPWVWGRAVIDVDDDKSELWLRLAQEVWKAANFDEDISNKNDDRDETDNKLPSESPRNASEYMAGSEVRNSSISSLHIDDGEEGAYEHGMSDGIKKTGKSQCHYSSDLRIARVLLGFVDPCEAVSELTTEQQDAFEQSTFSEIRHKNDSYVTGRDARLIYIKIIQKGRENGLWELCEPSYPVLINRPVPRNQVSNLKCLFEAREIRTTFLLAIKENRPWLAEHRKGVILLSAMLYDGLLENAAIEALELSINRPLVRGPTGYWLDLLINPGNQSRTRIRRFWPQPLTTILWLRYKYVPGEMDVCAVQAVSNLVRRLLLREPPSHHRLLKSIAQEISLEIPEMLVHVATGETLIHPIKAERWYAIEGLGCPESDVPDLIRKEIVEESSTSNLVSVIDEDKQTNNDPLLNLINPQGMPQLRQALLKKSIKEMRKALERVLQNESSQPPIVNHLARWLKNPSIKGVMSTRSWMFGIIGARLVSLCGEDDPALYDDDELESLYYLVLEDGKSSTHRQGMRYALMSFHRYLSMGDPIKRPAVLNLFERSEVSSRIITHDEYHIALNMLGKPGPTDTDPQWLLACQIALIIFFRLGLRRRELLWLPLHDIHGEYTIEILIRPFSERKIKTRNALRVLAVNGFLSETEFSLVQSWLIRRRNEAAVNSEHFYFFSMTNSERERISEVRIVDHIVEVLREVSGDPDIHIHHLRHSFSTWAVTSLIGDVIENDFSNWAHLPHTQTWLRSFPMVVRSYYLRESPQRSLLYLISTLMGHSTPAITMEHYIHLADYLLGSALGKALDIVPENIGSRGLGLLPRTYQRCVGEGWTGVLERLARRFPDRWNDGVHNIPGKRHASSQMTYSLYEKYRTMWQVLKWFSLQGVVESLNELAAEIDRDEFKRIRENAVVLNEKGLISKACPSFPYGEKREAIARVYSRLFEVAMQTDEGMKSVMKLSNFWLQHKLKGRGALRFRDPVAAKGYIESLRSLGITLSQMHFTWIGSRFTNREAKESHVYWRKELTLSRRTPIGIQSLQNDRPLKESKGYMDIRVVNSSYSQVGVISQASHEFQWVLVMFTLYRDI